MLASVYGEREARSGPVSQPAKWMFALGEIRAIIALMGRSDELFARLETHGESAIDELMADFQSENLWLDFKRSADDGAGAKLATLDREKLAKAISGFGNSDGGVIVWGVDCAKDPKSGADLPTGKRPIIKPERFVSWLENATSGCTFPPHGNVQHLAIRRSSGDEGFVITFVPMSLHAPHQCVQPTNDLRYYIRVGSNFSAVPHAVLAGLFGRRPQPKLGLWWRSALARMDGDTLVVEGMVSMRNASSTIARDLYFNLWAFAPGPNCSVAFDQISDAVWEVFRNATNFWNLVSRQGVRQPPGAPLSIGLFEVHLKPPFESPYSIDLSYGCEGGEMSQRRGDVAPAEVASMYADAPSALKTAAGIERIVNTILKT